MNGPKVKEHERSLSERLSCYFGDREADSFEDLVQAVFRHQFQHNQAYRAFSQHLGQLPETITSWREIPAVPTQAFKIPAHPLTCGDPIIKTFLTSGTTGETRGAHHFSDLSLYELAIDSYCPIPALNPLFLAPSATEAPQSSLAHMFAHLNPGDDSRFLLQDGKFALPTLFRELEKNEPILLLGTALAFLHLTESHTAIPLPPGSHLFETGGYKGTARTLAKEELYQQLSDFFQIPTTQIHNEYGMTELSSQAYATETDGRHRFPHWCRHLIIDPETEKPLPPGELGYLKIHDLANLHSVSAIQTQDFAIGHPDGSFQLMGRDPGALPRGCSRTIDHALSA